MASRAALVAAGVGGGLALALIVNPFIGATPGPSPARPAVDPGEFASLRQRMDTLARAVQRLPVRVAPAAALQGAPDETEREPARVAKPQRLPEPEDVQADSRPASSSRRGSTRPSPSIRPGPAAPSRS